MKRFAGILFLFLLPSLAAEDWVAIDKGAPRGTPPAVKVLTNRPEATRLEITIPGFWATKTPYGWKLRFPGRLITTEKGRPEIPFVGVTLALPQAGKPTGHLESADYVRPGTFTLRMAPKLELDGQLHTPPLPVAPQRAYPETYVNVAHHGMWRQVPAASLQIHPCKTTGTGVLLGVARRLVVAIKHPGAPKSWPDTVVDEEFKPLFESLFINGKAITTRPSAIDAPATEYLVITTTSLAPAVAPLLAWRQEQGYQTELLTISTLNTATIKGYIQTRFATTKLKYVLFVGDYAQIPWHVWSGNYSQSWYSCLTGGSSPDLYPDIGLGRLSGTSTTEITHQVNRILTYEKSPPAGKWLNNFVMTAHKESGATGRFTTCAESIANGPLQTSGWTTIKQYGYKSGVNNTTLTNNINNGAGIVFYRGHGSTTNWSSWCSGSPSSFGLSQVAALKHGTMTPLVFSICCTTGNFKSACYTEAWAQAQAGAIACVGACDVSYTSGNTPMAIEFCRAIFQDKDTNIFGFFNKGITKALQVGGSGGQKAAYLFCWMGDTCTNIWLKPPTKMTVTHDPSITTGLAYLAVNVKDGNLPLAGARICLHKNPDVFVQATTTAAGTAIFNFSPTSVGKITITVQAQDHLPYQGQISVLAGNPGGTIIPAGQAKAEGNTFMAVPTRFAPCRSQHIYDPTTMAGLPSGYIKGLNLRRDGLDQTTFAAHKYTFDVHVSSKGVPDHNTWSRSSYQANRGTDWVRIAKGMTLNFPTSPKPLAPPASFSLKIPFANPFLYLKGQGLLVQFDVTHQGTGQADNYWVADAQAFATKSGTAGKYGKGCPANRTMVGLVPAINTAAKLTFYWNSGGGYSSPAMAFLGSNDKAFGILPLPLSLAGIGAPGCALNTNIISTIPGTTAATGSNGQYRIELPLPKLKELAGLALFGQILVASPSYNTAGIMLSEGMKFTLGSYHEPCPVLHLYSKYTTQPFPFPDKPMYTRDAGLILEIVR